MRTHARILLVVTLFALAISAFGLQDQRLAARDELNQVYRRTGPPTTTKLSGALKMP
jgi:hypothetical protein